MKATVGSKIREVRMRKGITQTELANGLVTPSMISQIEADKANPSYSLLYAISERLETPLEYFLTDVQNQLEKTSAFRIAIAYINCQQDEEAIPFLQRLLEDDPPVIPILDVTYYLAVALLHTGKIHEAHAKFEYVLENALLQKNTERIIQCYIELGNLEFQEHDYPTAIHHWRRGYAQAKERELTDRYQLAQICRLLALAYDKIGDLDACHRYYTEAHQYVSTPETHREVADTYRRLATQAHEEGQFDVAIEYAMNASILSRQADLQKDILTIQIAYGKHIGENNQTEEAIQLLENTAKQAQVYGEEEEAGKAHIAIAEFLFDTHCEELALQYAINALQAVPKRTVMQADTLYLLANIHQKSGELNKALEMYQQAMLIYRDLDHAQGLMKCHSNLGIVYSNLGDFRHASDSLEQMRSALEQMLHERRVIS
ncbi:helix-turn-helix transcriptional regulator [Fodinisporobacter ferrooxydans]|uniref:Helix-turn-helix transcriptional regulator n=1 Tax=Fodinisporobacter ferrooxydans TaxID=2901836 RepID=A0ABY4CMB6_9BACL|nr:helix-turn-helix transcriptional regulator [Alicyclobacillaceae bacterium MYW30-H2]